MCETKTKKQILLDEKSYAMRSEAKKIYGKLNRAQNFGASKPSVKRGSQAPLLNPHQIHSTLLVILM